MVVRAASCAEPAYAGELAQTGRSPRFLYNAPVVLDLRGVENFTEASEFETAKES